MEERFGDFMENPKKRVRFFKVAVIASYSMLLLGSFLIVAYLASVWL
jgi:hypothetical protein